MQYGIIFRVSMLDVLRVLKRDRADLPSDKQEQDEELAIFEIIKERTNGAIDCSSDDLLVKYRENFLNAQWEVLVLSETPPPPASSEWLEPTPEGCQLVHRILYGNTSAG